MATLTAEEETTLTAAEEKTLRSWFLNSVGLTLGQTEVALRRCKQEAVVDAANVRSMFTVAPEDSKDLFPRGIWARIKEFLDGTKRQHDDSPQEREDCKRSRHTPSMETTGGDSVQTENETQAHKEKKEESSVPGKNDIFLKRGRGGDNDATKAYHQIVENAAQMWQESAEKEKFLSELWAEIRKETNCKAMWSKDEYSKGKDEYSKVPEDKVPYKIRKKLEDLLRNRKKAFRLKSPPETVGNVNEERQQQQSPVVKTAYPANTAQLVTLEGERNIVSTGFGTAAVADAVPAACDMYNQYQQSQERGYPVQHQPLPQNFALSPGGQPYYGGQQHCAAVTTDPNQTTRCGVERSDAPGTGELTLESFFESTGDVEFLPN